MELERYNLRLVQRASMGADHPIIHTVLGLQPAFDGPIYLPVAIVSLDRP
jgi:hypothetical protein